MEIIIYTNNTMRELKTLMTFLTNIGDVYTMQLIKKNMTLHVIFLKNTSAEKRNFSLEKKRYKQNDFMLQKTEIKMHSAKLFALA